MHANTFTHGQNPMGSYCKPYPFDQGWWSFFAIFPHFTTVCKLDGISGDVQYKEINFTLLIPMPEVD